MPTIVMQHSNPTTSHSAAVCSLCAFVLEYVYMLYEYQGQAGAQECCPITLPYYISLFGDLRPKLQCVAMCFNLLILQMFDSGPLQCVPAAAR